MQLSGYLTAAPPLTYSGNIQPETRVVLESCECKNHELAQNMCLQFTLLNFTAHFLREILLDDNAVLQCQKVRHIGAGGGVTFSSDQENFYGHFPWVKCPLLTSLIIRTFRTTNAVIYICCVWQMCSQWGMSKLSWSMGVISYISGAHTSNPLSGILRNFKEYGLLLLNVIILQVYQRCVSCLKSLWGTR